jgi:hypothetical protein
MRRNDCPRWAGICTVSAIYSGMFFQRLVGEGRVRHCPIHRLPILIAFLFCPIWAEITRAHGGLESRPDQSRWLEQRAHHLFQNCLRNGCWQRRPSRRQTARLLADSSLDTLIAFRFCPIWAEIIHAPSDLQSRPDGSSVWNSGPTIFSATSLRNGCWCTETKPSPAGQFIGLPSAHDVLPDLGRNYLMQNSHAPAGRMSLGLKAHSSSFQTPILHS